MKESVWAVLDITIVSLSLLCRKWIFASQAYPFVYPLVSHILGKMYW